MHDWQEKWLEEQEIAQIHGWDFSHIAERTREETDYPWDYRRTIGRYLTPQMRLLDVDTGGGEFLLRLGHPYENTAATEGYGPNVQLCRRTLLPLGIDFRPGVVGEGLPFESESFDVILNRHGDLSPREFYRLLKPGGLVITQQVGAENDRELVQLLCGDTPMPFPDQYLKLAQVQFARVGFRVLEALECYRNYDFFDVGALVWFARVIPWEFPDFSVETHLENLHKAQLLLEEKGYLRCRTHRFFLVAQKPR